MEIEEEELVPVMDSFISSVCQDIQDQFPKVEKKRLYRKTTLLSHWKQLQQCGTSSMNTSEANSSFCTQITSHCRSTDTYRTKH
jgi:hypothetical protein